MTSSNTGTAPDRSQVLGKTVLKASANIGLSLSELSNVLGIEGQDMDRVVEDKLLDPQTPAGKAALCLIQAIKDIDILMGGDQKLMRHFFRHHSNLCEGVPAKLVQTESGLDKALTALAIMRRKP